MITAPRSETINSSKPIENTLLPAPGTDAIISKTSEFKEEVPVQNTIDTKNISLVRLFLNRTPSISEYALLIKILICVILGMTCVLLYMISLIHMFQEQVQCLDLSVLNQKELLSNLITLYSQTLPPNAPTTNEAQKWYPFLLQCIKTTLYSIIITAQTITQVQALIAFIKYWIR